MRASRILRAGRIVLALMLLHAVSLPQAMAADQVLDGVIALVNGKAITKFELDERLLPIYEQTRGRVLSTEELSQVAAIKQQALQQLVDELLIQQDAERYKLKVTDQEVEAQVKTFLAQRNLSEDEFRRQLSLQRISREEFVRNMRRDMIKHRLIGGVVTSKVVVTDSEVEQRYKERLSEFSKDSMVQLAIILVPANMGAAELKARIESGELSFADAANKYSQGPGVGHGGEIGYIAWKDLAPEWNEALSGLKPGQVSAPVRVQDNAGLLQVMSLKEGEQLPLDAVREQIYQSMQEAKFNKVFQEYLQKLRDKAVIEYRNL